MAIWKRRKAKKTFKDYKSYKPWLREDFRYACVYCTIHEGEFGGFHSFHVEHFRPKSRFPKLETEYTNLLYACWKCNSYKSEDWPSGYPLKSGKGYLDPCSHDYEKYFTINSDGVVMGNVGAAKYMIENLHLNSNFLIKTRNDRKRIRESIDECKSIIKEIDSILNDEKSPTKIRSLDRIKSITISSLENREKELTARLSPPFEPEDLR